MNGTDLLLLALADLEEAAMNPGGEKNAALIARWKAGRATEKDRQAVAERVQHLADDMLVEARAQSWN